MARRFARFRTGPPAPGPGYSELPSDGMCLNAFLLLRAPTDPGRVLLGHISPDPRWFEVGALDAGRAAHTAGRWMLPSRQLALFESPAAAAVSIAREQLGIDLASVPAPEVFSETYSRPGSTESDPHWDLHFIFSLTGPRDPPTSSLWTELAYVPAATTPRASFARGHGDILELVGLPPAP